MGLISSIDLVFIVLFLGQFVRIYFLAIVGYMGSHLAYNNTTSVHYIVAGPRWLSRKTKAKMFITQTNLPKSIELIKVIT